MGKIESFKPVINEESKVLILGSMPGIMSLDNVEYYGNPRNHFWSIIFDLFNEPLQEEYEKKISFILNHGIALWDVIENCERRGSLDVNIKNEQPNDLPGLLRIYPGIQAVVFNGGKAHDIYRKRIGFHHVPAIDYIKLPSTSPIPGRNIKTYDEKLESWKVVREYCEKERRNVDHQVRKV